MASLLERVLTDGKRDFILVEDEVASASNLQTPIRIADATTLVANISVEEWPVKRMREKHPNVPVYGFWHVLIHSGIVDPKADFDSYVYFADKDAETGSVLEVRDGYVHESVPMMGGLPAAVAINRPRYITADDLRLIELPPEPILLPSERDAVRRAKLRSMAVVGGIAAAGGVLIALGADLYLAGVSERLQRQAQQINQQADIVQGQVNALRLERDPLTVEQRTLAHVAIANLTEVVTLSENARGVITSPMESPIATLEVGALPMGLSFPTIGAATPATTPTITFSLDGVTEPTAVEAVAQ